MKNLYFLVVLLTLSVSYGQDKNLGKTENIAESEMKSASRVIQMAVNPNTQNYDITYHKLEFTVDPAVYNVAGKITTTYTALSNMNTITFDLANELSVSAVKQGTTNLTFLQNLFGSLIHHVAKM